MKVHATLRTSVYRGDHSADVVEAVTVQDGESVADLCRRLLSVEPSALPVGADERTVRVCDWIELRVEAEDGDKRDRA